MTTARALAALALALSACAGTTTASTTPPSTTEAASTTTETTTTTAQPVGSTIGLVAPIGGGVIQSIAPDGSHLLFTRDELVCVQMIDLAAPAGDQLVSCLPWREDVSGRVDLSSSWSPDAGTVVFFDRIRVFSEFIGSVWHIDTEELVVEEAVEEGELLPLAVAVSHDAVAINGAQAGEATSVLLLSESGALEPLADVAVRQFEWLPDGSALIASGTSGEQDGFWHIDAATGATRLVAGVDEARGWDWLSGVSPDGTRALVFHRTLAAAEFFPAGVQLFSLLDLATGDMTPLMSSPPDEFVGPVAAAFSPDGTSIAYLYHAGTNLDAPPVVAVRTADDREEIISTDVLRDAGLAPEAGRALDTGIGPVWTASGHLLLPTADWVLVVDLGG